MKDVIVIGMGQLGGLYAQGFSQSGYTVHAVRRPSPTEPSALASAVRDVAAPELVLVAVGEQQLDGVLSELAAHPRLPIALLQNELLPSQWQRHAIQEPSVSIVWFEKKADRDVHVVLPTRVCGAQSRILMEAHAALGIPAYEVEPSALVYELVLKNLYILVINIAGLVLEGNVGQVWERERERVESIAHDVIELQRALCGAQLDSDRLMSDLQSAFAADPEHGCQGRTARQRLERALQSAHALGVNVPELEAVESRVSSSARPSP